ncbi:DUF6193 family natural product biosynthesis protein [Dactylosporangium cerinum]|uniref:DUF6193 family natural product biosynthesis protein n=1 Tax=Dactylosporangium cerinum TaxID=1434730 RepID=A0ABV9WCR9_9ACTN
MSGYAPWVRLRHNRSVMSADLDALYPDIAAEGGLVSALSAVAMKQGLSVPFTSPEPGSLRSATATSTVSHRNHLTIDAWTVKRRWSITGCESFQGLALIEGDTEDPAQIARAAQAWHDGAALAEIRRVATFVKLTGRFEVPDHDAVQLAESEWQCLRLEATEMNLPQYQAMVEAAYHEPALRRLYPFTSHSTLRFAITTRPNLSVVPVCLDAHQDNRYTVNAEFLGEILAETSTAQEAVLLAVSQLPPDLGPVELGVPRS